jgi:hypothetical protein
MNPELKKLGLSSRTSNSLYRVGVNTLDLLLQVTVEELQKQVPDLGKTGIDSILKVVSEKGFKLVGQDLYEEKQKRNKLNRNAFSKHIAAVEREACAKVAEQSFGVIGSTIALAIRAREEQA